MDGNQMIIKAKEILILGSSTFIREIGLISVKGGYVNLRVHAYAGAPPINPKQGAL